MNFNLHIQRLHKDSRMPWKRFNLCTKRSRVHQKMNKDANTVLSSLHYVCNISTMFYQFFFLPSSFLFSRYMRILVSTTLRVSMQMTCLLEAKTDKYGVLIYITSDFHRHYVTSVYGCKTRIPFLLITISLYGITVATRIVFSITY